MKYKLLSLSASISRKMGGIFAVQRNQAISLLDRSIDITVCGLSDDFSYEDLDLWSPIVPHHFGLIGPKQFNYSPTLKKFVLSKEFDLIHLHSIWDYPSQIVSRMKTPLIISPNGMLNAEALKVSLWKKKLALFFYQKKALERASVIQVSTRAEYNEIRNMGLTNPVALIGNGVKIPDNLPSKSAPWPNDNKKTLLYLGRIHELKGIQNLIDSFIQLKSKKEIIDWKLAVVGFGFHNNAFESLLKSKQSDYLLNDVHLIEGQYGEKMTLCYQNSNAFILPSLNEGLPIAVLEAWANSKPVLITEACNFETAFQDGAAIRIESTRESIQEGLLTLVGLSEVERRNMGKNGLELVKHKYSWTAIAAEYDELYQWVLDSSREIPNSIVRDQYGK